MISATVSAYAALQNEAVSVLYAVYGHPSIRASEGVIDADLPIAMGVYPPALVNVTTAFRDNTECLSITGAGHPGGSKPFQLLITVEAFERIAADRRN